MKLGYGNYSVQQAAEGRCLFAELTEQAARERAAQAAQNVGGVAVEAMIPEPRQAEILATEVQAQVQ